MTDVEPVLVGTTIQTNSCYCGIDSNRIQLPPNCILLGVMREGQVILASAEEIIIHFGDYVLALALIPAIAPALKAILKKTHPVSWSPLKCSLNWESDLYRLQSNFFNLCLSKDCTQLL